jgi:hypothetical protein
MTQRAEQLLRSVDELAASLLAAVWEHLPGYEPTRMDREDLAAVVEPNLRVMLTAFAENRRPTGEELASARALGERRAVQGVPVEGMLASWRAAERVLLVRLVDAPGPVPLQDLSRTSRRLATVVDTLTEAATAAYRRTRAEMALHLEHIETDLVSRLAAGEPLDPEEIEDRAQLIGAETQRPHRAVAAALAGDDDPVALGRAYRLLLDHLRPRLGGRVLSGSHRGTRLALFPDTADAVSRLEQAVHRTGMPPDLVLGLGDPRARLGDAAASCREALAALDVGIRLGARHTVVSYRAVMPEVLLAANPLTARNIVESTLGPLLAQPNLLVTLSTYLDNRLSTRTTAERLQVHENTVAYRLRRVADLLQVDSPARLARLDVLMALRTLELLPEIGEPVRQSRT